MALQMLQVFAVELKEKYAEYVEETTKIVQPMLAFGPNSGLRKESANILPSLLSCLKKAEIPNEALIIAGKRYISDLLEAHDKELSTEVKISQILAIKSVYETMGHFMSPGDTKIIIERILGYFKTSNDLRNVIVQKEKDEKDEDDEEEEEASKDTQKDIDAEEDYQKNLTYFLGAVENSHKDETIPEIPIITTNIIQPYLIGNTAYQKIALFIIDDFLEYLTVEKLGLETWKQFAVIILTYTSRVEHELRQAACYGVGALSQGGSTAFSEISLQCLTALAAAIEVKEDPKRKDEWLAARDNAISSIGKILKYQPTSVPFGDIWSKWVCYLPIKDDLPEAKFVHNFLAETIIANPESSLGSNGSLLGEIIRIFIKVHKGNLIKKIDKPKITAALKKLAENPTIAAMMDDIYKNNLRPEDKSIFEEIVKAN